MVKIHKYLLPSFKTMGLLMLNFHSSSHSPKCISITRNCNNLFLGAAKNEMAIPCFCNLLGNVNHYLSPFKSSPFIQYLFFKTPLSSYCLKSSLPPSCLDTICMYLKPWQVSHFSATNLHWLPSVQNLHFLPSTVQSLHFLPVVKV